MSDIVRYGVMSDTHDSLPARLFEVFEGVERVFHCGDLGSREVAAELEAIAPLTAVSGNMDPWPIVSLYPDEVVEDFEFGTVAMTHGAAFSHNTDRMVKGLLKRYASLAPRLILFGHTHEPFLKKNGHSLILNPGAVTFPHAGEPPTVAILEYDRERDKLTAKHISLS